MPDRHAEPLAMLRVLKLPAVADTFADLALKAAKAGLTHQAFLYEVVKAEVAQREQHRIARLQRRAGLPAEKTFRTSSSSASRPPCASRSSGCARAPSSARRSTSWPSGARGWGKAMCSRPSRTS